MKPFSVNHPEINQTTTANGIVAKHAFCSSISFYLLLTVPESSVFFFHFTAALVVFSAYCQSADAHRGGRQSLPGNNPS